MPIGGKMLRGVPIILDYDPLRTKKHWDEVNRLKNEEAVRTGTLHLTMDIVEYTAPVGQFILAENGNVIPNPAYQNTTV